MLSILSSLKFCRYEQFLLFPQGFQKACFPGASKGFIVWEWVKSLPHNSDFYRTCKSMLLKTFWEREKAKNRDFLLVP